MILILLFSLSANAQFAPQSQSVFSLPSKKSDRQSAIAQKETPIDELRNSAVQLESTPRVTKRRINQPTSAAVSGLRLRSSPLSSSEAPFINVKIVKEKLPGLIRSSILKARINDSITAYEGSKDPVRAVVTEGPYKGAVLFGNATMDKVTKTAVVAFDTFIPSDSQETFKFLATIKDQDGNTGLTGVVESDYLRYFLTQIALDTASAAADAATQKTQSAFGGYNPVPGPDSTIKQGIAGGLAKTADRIAEKNQPLPEFVKVEGPIYIRVSVLEQPERN